MSKFIIKQSRARAGNRYRVAVVETTNGEMPCRIDARLSNVTRVVKVWEDLPDPAQAMPAAVELANGLNQGPTVHKIDKPVPKFRCPNCQGTGKISTFEHVDNGVCFRCHGTGALSYKQQWNAFYPYYRDFDEQSRKRIKWLMNATEADWSRLTLEQMRNVEQWVDNTLANQYTLPQAALDRLGSLLDAEPKPF